MFVVFQIFNYQYSIAGSTSSDLIAATEKTNSVFICQIIFVCFIMCGASMSLADAWNLADALNGFMAIPNLIALLALSGTTIEMTMDHMKHR